MPFGRYILDAANYNQIYNKSYHYIYSYDEYSIPVILDSKGTFITNTFGVNALLYNNTFLLASPYTNNINTSWSLFTIPLTKVLTYRDKNTDKTPTSPNTLISLINSSNNPGNANFDELEER
ncbi:2566_t:CDS:2 [Dentiscutata heterogama]|uniref:2566_t:CDS:1 n=1 Tax=Dentiscutata heterogama TaxID=1316150 RepID=A0ACA9K7C9_9GLOM|nr:2566_t:CDS:2 [Dentiscutata heterogama]